MGSSSINNNNQASSIGSPWSWLTALPTKLSANVVGFASMIVKIGRDDPRRLIHSVKVGLAITAVSLLYYLKPLYNSFGVSAMWAVMTVVVVFEFTVGATLGKGLNRAMATLLGGGLGVGTHYLSSLCGEIGEPFLIGSFVFLLAAASTFARFFPKIKARYDYGFLIFILTFSLVSISGFRVDEIIELAHKRLSTIVIGAFVTLLINIFIFPVWAGEELHKSLSLNMEKLGLFLEVGSWDKEPLAGFGAIYFKEILANSKDDGSKLLLQGFKSVLNSKSAEENLANFACWEPGHGQFRYNHPWKEYLKLGVLVRQCAYRIDALSVVFNPNTQAPHKFPEEMRDACIKMSLESGKALKELGACLRTMNQPSSSVNDHIMSSKSAVKTVKSLFKSSSLWQDCDLLQVIPAATIASLLADVVNCVDKIAASVHELENIAHFKRFEGSNVSPKISRSNNQHQAVNQDIDCPHIVVPIGDLALTRSN